MTSFEFAGHFLDLRQGRLRRAHVDVQLRHKSFSLLAYLVQNRGRVIGKDELFSVIWPEVTVSDGSLTQCIADIRRCLGPAARSLIRTVPRRGYILDESDVQLTMPEAIGLERPRQAEQSFERTAPPFEFDDPNARAGGEAPAANRPDIQALRNVPILALLDSPRLKLVAFTSERLSLAEGDVLFYQGERADAAYIVLSGSLDAYLERSGGRFHLSRNAEHAVIGEMGLINNAPRSATIVAGSAVEVLRISKDVFLDLIAEVPTMALAIMREQIARLNQTEKRLKE
jgi:DNA-binding winged helix-turn-helix (wHTH) protein